MRHYGTTHELSTLRKVSISSDDQCLHGAVLSSQRDADVDRRYRAGLLAKFSLRVNRGSIETSTLPMKYVLENDIPKRLVLYGKDLG